MLNRVLTDRLVVVYEETGQPVSYPVVLLHGFPDDVRGWDSVVPALVESGFRTIVPYLRGLGLTRFRSTSTYKSGQQAALANDLHGLIVALNLPKSILVGYDWGARAACTVAALWPKQVGGLVSIGGYNIEGSELDQKPAPATEEYKAWYHWYFHTERGKSGLEQNRRQICRLLWELWSPNWRFTDAEFNETAESFDNPDFVEIVIHSYRHRYGAAAGDPELAHLEQQLLGQPKITVPTTVLHGDGDGVHPPERSEGQEGLFSDYYEREVVASAGHFFPREAPDAVVAAI